MTWRRFLGIRRQPDQWTSSHERARVRAAERLDWTLDAGEDAWLVEHLAGCPECSSIAAEYEAQRVELGGLRGEEPAAPRDLWARTAAAIESETRARAGAAGVRRRRPALGVPLGAISGVLVVAVVIGASLLSQGTPIPPSSSPVAGTPAAPATPRPVPTPFLVPAADDVAWIEVGDAGEVDVLSAAIGEVCPDDPDAGCAPMDGAPTRSLKLAQAPVAVVHSPAEGELIVVDRPTGETSVTVYAVPAPTPTLRASPSPTLVTSPAETAVPTLTQEPTASPEPTPSEPASAEPSGSPPKPTEPASPPPVMATPALPVEGAVAIATDVVLVGDGAAYSPDGRWFAFSARPGDGSTGPDVYVWQSGQVVAVPLTTDHRTVFASWLGGQVLAGRVGDPGAPRVLEGEMLSIDPASGVETSIGTGAWRPAVRPGEDAAVYWAGTLESDPGGVILRPADGRLVLGPWPVGSRDREPQVLESDTIADWDARWDATGTRLAVWIADEVDQDLGRLSVYIVDRESGRLDRGDSPLVDVPARRGFSIGDGRLAWVTPAGQDGEGSRVQVLAWTEDGFGKVETLPGEDQIVVIR